MKSFIITVIASLFLINSYAQEEKSNEFRREFGGHVGSTTGIGLSYRQWFGNFGAQITGIPVKTDDFTFISGAVSAMYSLKQTKYIRAYLYLGNHLIFTDDNYYYDPYYYGPDYTSDSDYIYSIGFGPGFTFGRTVAFNIQVGYGVYDLLNDFKMLPAGEMGLYYRF